MAFVRIAENHGRLAVKVTCVLVVDRSQGYDGLSPRPIVVPLKSFMEVPGQIPGQSCSFTCRSLLSGFLQVSDGLPDLFQKLIRDGVSRSRLPRWLGWCQLGCGKFKVARRSRYVGIIQVIADCPRSILWLKDAHLEQRLDRFAVGPI